MNLLGFTQLTRFKRAARVVLPERLFRKTTALYRQLSHRRSQRLRQGFQEFVCNLEVNGTQFEFLIGDPTGKEWYFDNRGLRNSEQVRWLTERMVSPGDTVLECGAHHGLFALVMSRRVGDRGHVYCVEAHPANVAILRRNLNLNGISNVTVIHRAVGGRNGSTQIVDSSNSRIPSRTDAELPQLEVACSTIDDIAFEIGATPDVLMLDIEGMELAALAAAQKLLARKPKLAIEIHASPSRDPFPILSSHLLSVAPLREYDLYLQAGEEGHAVASSLPFVIKSKTQLYALPRGAPQP